MNYKEIKLISLKKQRNIYYGSAEENCVETNCGKYNFRWKKVTEAKG